MTFSTDHQDALTELLNIGVGQAAAVLNEMVESHITLSVPSITVVKLEDLVSEFGVEPDERLASVSLEFDGGFSGATSLIFTTPCAIKLVEALTGEASPDGDQLDSIRIGTLIEVGNILVNGVMGSIANNLDTHIEYQVPSYIEGTVGEILADTESGVPRQIILARTSLSLEQYEVQGDILLYLELGTFDSLIRSLECAS